MNPREGGAFLRQDTDFEKEIAAVITRILTCAAAAALTIPAAPAAFAAATAAHPTAGASAFAIESFYDARDEAPLWLRSDSARRAAVRFTDVLRRSELDGFAEGPQLADRISAALDRARTGSPAAVTEAERLLSSAWIDYVQAISWPTSGIIFGDQSLVPRIPTSGEILRAAADAPSLDGHVEQISSVNPIYAQLRDAAWKAKLAGDAELQKQVMANMDRARALPSSGRFLLVDIATARLWMYEDGQVRDSMKVVVGKPDQQTPMVVSSVRHAVLNPYWHVPVDMVRTLVAPNVLREGVGYLRSRGYEVVSDYGENPQQISPDEVDWDAVADGRAEAHVRQQPGPSNAMGEIKIMFSNARGIYLHDTPEKALFREAQRTFSGGCIRLQDAPRLAQWLIGHKPVAASSEPEQRVELPAPVPIYVTYLTVQPNNDGELAFAKDVYGLDRSADTALAAR